jgi:alkylated DNA repair dioxygenase AlkB
MPRNANACAYKASSVAEPPWQRLALDDADVRITELLNPAQALPLFERLRADIPWERHRLRLFGCEVDAPRLSCWIGDPGTAYRYSGTRFEPHPWPPLLAELRQRVADVCEEDFNSVLCNLYRNGQDSMGWHADDEAELGSEPTIASLSLGAVRRFRLRHKHDPLRRLELNLPSGSLLLMAGATQRNYRHDLPKTARKVGERINLTFRRINS